MSRSQHWSSMLEVVLVTSSIVVLMLLANNVGYSDQAVCDAEKVLCQATYYNQFVAQLAQNRKAMIENNKFFVSVHLYLLSPLIPCLLSYQFNGTCQLQCQIKAGKNVQTLPTIDSPDFVSCNVLQNKYSKQKQYCYQGQCLTVQQIADQIDGGVTTTANFIRRRKPSFGGGEEVDDGDLLSGGGDTGTWVLRPRDEVVAKDTEDD